MTDLVTSAASCYSMLTSSRCLMLNLENVLLERRDPEEPESWNQTAGAVVRLQAPSACALGKHPNCAYASFSYL